MKVLRLVPLAGGASTDKVLDDGPYAQEVEVTVKAMEGALNALVAVIVHGSQQLL
jgi:hypothetical protein